MEEIIPFKGENWSHALTTNLLFREDNIYLMDNHRMAAWCWVQNIDFTKQYTIIHIDKHYDTSTHYQLDIYCQNLDNDFKRLSAVEYDKIDYEFSKNEWSPIFRWDNYIPIFHNLHKKNIKEYMFFTQECGEFWKELDTITTHYSPFNLINDFADYFEQSKTNLIINLDIDYFFSDYPKYEIIFSDKIIDGILDNIKKLIVESNNVLTVALSPECCGGWQNSISFIKKFGHKIGLNNVPI